MKKNLLSRSGTTVGAALVALKGIAPEAPWWAFLILAVVVIVTEQAFRPSVPAKKVEGVIQENVDAIRRIEATNDDHPLGI
jgi:hypothetical protein